MDNITHSITAVALTSVCLKNTEANKYIFRFLFVALFLVNLPDFDFIVYFIRAEMYYEQHRGYTHSILGGLTLVPLGMYIIKKVYKSVVDIPNKTAFITSFVLWFIGHFTLDYFTVYGIQIFWPLNVTHYDYALMFIIDLVVWLFAFTYIVLYWLKRFNKLRLSYMFLGFLTFIYSLYFVQKQYILYDFSKNYNVKKAYYSIFINPFYNVRVYGFDNTGKLVQVVYNGFTAVKRGDDNTTPNYPYISSDYAINALPNNGQYNDKAKHKLKRYIKYGRIIGCRAIDRGALCTSFKYFAPSINDSLLNRKTLSKIILFNH